MNGLDERLAIIQQGEQMASGHNLANGI